NSHTFLRASGQCGGDRGTFSPPAPGVICPAAASGAGLAQDIAEPTAPNGEVLENQGEDRRAFTKRRANSARSRAVFAERKARAVSLTSIINAGMSGLMAAQTQLRVVSDNISNVSTPGYIRKVAYQTPIVMPGGQGAGVEVTSVKLSTDIY